MAQSKAYDSNADQWPKYSGFKALHPDRTEIRLLQLENGANSSRLRYVMHHAELSSSPKYCAMSYSWGAPVPASALKEIFIQGESVWIRPTLCSFLETMATCYPRMSMWIDAICINQGDVEERNHQISIMGEIYKTAREVYAWLGSGDDDTNYAIEHVENSNPQTRFDQAIFSTCAEKLFRLPYWTRRWVIQEFALAQELIVVCGRRLINWHHLTRKIDAGVLGGDASAQRTLENFKKVKLLGSQERMSLLELMEQFRDARCIDPRDKVFALRSIANDGVRLLANYNDRAADVYFRVLSMLPTERVLPEVSGYRWPHRSASQLQSLMQLTKEDLLSSLVRSTDDRLYTVFEYAGVIATVLEALQEEQRPSSFNLLSSFPLEARLQGSTAGVLYGSGSLRAGDLVYSLQSTPQSPKGLYIAFRPSLMDAAVVGMLINEPDTVGVTYWTKMGLCEKKIKLIENIVRCGVLKCSRNTSASSLQDRVLCHVDRLVLILFWLLDIRQFDYLWDSQRELPDQPVGANLLCSCLKDERAPPSLDVNSLKPQNYRLEILPSFHSPENEGLWAAAITQPWSVAGFQLSQEQHEINESPWKDPSPLDFYCRGRTELSYAAGDGHMAFTNRFLSERTIDVNSRDESGQTSLSWASRNGRDAVVKQLVSRDDVKADCKDNSGRTPLWWAASEGHEKVVQALLGTGKVDPDCKDDRGLTPL
ncbi:hypothetical protein H2202_001350 [Exophiala xenobiotica]|nr:hypothetical protein H2202_001350 [Exophiala xenobiotica]